MLVINPLIYAEVSVRFERIEELDAALPPTLFRRDGLPWQAGFPAGKCFLAYRRAGGARRSPLPDFYVGAHAAIRGHALLARDQTYFPTVELLAPWARARARARAARRGDHDPGAAEQVFAEPVLMIRRRGGSRSRTRSGWPAGSICTSMRAGIRSTLTTR